MIQSRDSLFTASALRIHLYQRIRPLRELGNGKSRLTSTTQHNFFQKNAYSAMRWPPQLYHHQLFAIHSYSTILPEGNSKQDSFWIVATKIEQEQYCLCTSSVCRTIQQRFFYVMLILASYSAGWSSPGKQGAHDDQTNARKLSLWMCVFLGTNQWMQQQNKALPPLVSAIDPKPVVQLLS